jgi:hypothetical protein
MHNKLNSFELQWLGVPFCGSLARNSISMNSILVFAIDYLAAVSHLVVTAIASKLSHGFHLQSSFMATIFLDFYLIKIGLGHFVTHFQLFIYFFCIVY